MSVTLLLSALRAKLTFFDWRTVSILKVNKTIVCVLFIRVILTYRVSDAHMREERRLAEKLRRMRKNRVSTYGSTESR